MACLNTFHWHTAWNRMVIVYQYFLNGFYAICDKLGNYSIAHQSDLTCYVY